jgi:hypothetical protein
VGSVYLRQGKLDSAEKALRDSLGRVRSNGWAPAGLAEVCCRGRPTAVCEDEFDACLAVQLSRARLPEPALR